jgi:hypothetical protein
MRKNKNLNQHHNEMGIPHYKHKTPTIHKRLSKRHTTSRKPVLFSTSDEGIWGGVVSLLPNPVGLGTESRQGLLTRICFVWHLRCGIRLSSFFVVVEVFFYCFSLSYPLHSKITPGVSLNVAGIRRTYSVISTQDRVESTGDTGKKKML